MMFYLLLTFNYGGMILFVFNYVPDLIFFIHSFGVIILASLELILIFKNPGYVEKDKSLDFINLLKTDNIDKVCPS